MANLADFVDFLQDSGLVMRGEDMFSGNYLALGIIRPDESIKTKGSRFPTGIIGPKNFEDMTHFYVNHQGSDYELLQSVPDFIENKVTYDFKHKQSEDKGCRVEVYNFNNNLPRDINYEKLEFSDYLANGNPFSSGSGFVPDSCWGEQD